MKRYPWLSAFFVLVLLLTSVVNPFPAYAQDPMPDDPTLTQSTPVVPTVHPSDPAPSTPTPAASDALAQPTLVITATVPVITATASTEGAPAAPSGPAAADPLYREGFDNYVFLPSLARTGAGQTGDTGGDGDDGSGGGGDDDGSGGGGDDGSGGGGDDGTGGGGGTDGGGSEGTGGNTTDSTAADGWPMVAANPQRTSWTPEEVPGSLKPEWFKHFDGYISQKVQIIASYGKLYIAHSQGLKVINAENGNEVWNYATSLPLGNSPTVHNGVVYAPGFDKKLHALDAHNGTLLWTFQGGAGFQTNPLIAENLLLAGNRDGKFYAIYISGTQRGQVAWSFKTGGPVLFSAAYADGVVYFASQDNHAYALRAANGSQVWKKKLPGHGFHSWWPVIYRDQVVFSGSWNFRYPQPAPQQHIGLNSPEILETYPAGATDGTPLGPLGQEPGDWISGQQTVNAQGAAQYYEKYPDRRTVFVLNRQTGAELTYDSDGDGKKEYAPFLWFGTHAGTRYPAAVGPDNVLYQAAPMNYRKVIPRGRIVGWKIGTPFLSMTKGSDTAVDEPVAYAIGGNTVYWKRCCDRMAGAFQVDRPTGTAADLQSWVYFDEGGKILRRSLPELFEEGWDFAYWKHGDQSPPIPYRGRVYIIVNNAVVAFSPNGRNPVLPSTQDPGLIRGEKAANIERGKTAVGLNTNVTLSATQWPLIIRQELYYVTDDRPETRGRYFRLLEVTNGGAAPTAMTSQEIAGITTRMDSTIGGGRLSTWVSRRAPATLFENTTATYQLNGTFTGMAYLSGSGVRVLNGAATVAGSDLKAGWLLVWDKTDVHRWSPIVISLQRRPGQLVFSPTGIKLTYTGAAGFLAVTPLYGLSAPFSNEVSQWPSGIPTATKDRVQLIDRLARAFPLSVQETQALDNASGNYTITYNYTFTEFAGDWATSPLRVAYLPPQLALAAWAPDAAHASPIRINGQPLSSHFDLGWVSSLGRVAGVSNNAQATVVLPGIAQYWRGNFYPGGSYNANDSLNVRLKDEVQKILNAGHLRPAYGMVGIWESKGIHRLGDNLIDYWRNPSEIVITLAAALPYLPADMQAQVKTYLQNEISQFPLESTIHTGWNSGTPRDSFDLPVDVQQAASTLGPSSSTNFNRWGLSPINLYGMARYAGVFGNAATLFPKAKAKLDLTPQFETSIPYVVNTYLAGYTGYLRLAALANAGPQPEAEKAMVDMFITRAALAKFPRALEQSGFEYGGYKWTVRKFTPYAADTLFDVTITGNLWNQIDLYGYPKDWQTGLSGPVLGGGYAFTIDYVNLTPETAAFMRQYVPAEATEIWQSYAQRAPHWFVSEAEENGGESVYQPLFNRAAFFQARALVLQKPRAELTPFLDVPSVPLGDLYYIQNLIYTLQAP